MIEAEWWDYDRRRRDGGRRRGRHRLHHRKRARCPRRGADRGSGRQDARCRSTRSSPQAKLNWKKVTIIPTDDRLVPLTDEKSNIRAIAQAFLPTGARVFPITSDIADYKLAGNSANAKLADLKFPLDLAWLGVGSDGHTASIFPGPDLDEALNAPKGRHAVGVMPDPLPPEAPVARVTLTRSAILSARTVLITVTGEEKKAMLEGAIADGQSSKLPIGRVLAEAEQPIDIHWCRVKYCEARACIRC